MAGQDRSTGGAFTCPASFASLPLFDVSDRVPLGGRAGGHRFRLRVTTPRAVLDTLHWLSFTITAMPNLNLTPTPLIAGQAWSLPYEWWFYLSLPLAGALLGTRSGRGWLIVGAHRRGRRLVVDF